MNLFSDHRLGGTFQEVPDVEVRGGIQRTEDRRSGVGPLNGHHGVSTTPPLRHGMLVPDRVQPDAAVPTSHLENKPEGMDGPWIGTSVGGVVYSQGVYRRWEY